MGDGPYLQAAVTEAHERIRELEAELARVREERDAALAKWREAEDDGREAEARVVRLEAALREIEAGVGLTKCEACARVARAALAGSEEEREWLSD